MVSIFMPRLVVPRHGRQFIGRPAFGVKPQLCASSEEPEAERDHRVADRRAAGVGEDAELDRRVANSFAIS
jgi:hypothetical protein